MTYTIIFFRDRSFYILKSHRKLQDVEDFALKHYLNNKCIAYLIY